MNRVFFDVPPSAARLTGSLRDIGYDFPTAVADLVDNSIAAGATRVGVDLVFEPNESYVLISDNGTGMTPSGMLEALRFGSRRKYRHNELGRFGLGLKTGSFSQCRRLSIVSRQSKVRDTKHVRTLDLGIIEESDDWTVLANEWGSAIERARLLLMDEPGTVVVWEDLDRVLPDRYAESGWGRRRLNTLAKRTSEHLAMVFHRFLAGSHGLESITITVNDEKLMPWDPFAVGEPSTVALAPELFELSTPVGTSTVKFTGYVLPPRDKFSSPEQFESLSGPLKWNRQQGLYVYRANRLVQYGGWNGVRGIDEHTKLARASIDFDTDLDEAFQINVAKMKVVLPVGLKGVLDRPIHDLCFRADAAYRQSASTKKPTHERHADGSEHAAPSDVVLALKAAVLETSDADVYRRAMEAFRRNHPELSRSLGF